MTPKMKAEENGRTAVGLDPVMAGAGPAGEILNLDEASRYLRIKRRTLYSLAARGVVPGAKIGGQWRFRRSQLEGLFDGGRPVRHVPGASDGEGAR